MNWLILKISLFLDSATHARTQPCIGAVRAKRLCSDQKHGGSSPGLLVFDDSLEIVTQWTSGDLETELKTAGHGKRARAFILIKTLLNIIITFSPLFRHHHCRLHDNFCKSKRIAMYCGCVNTWRLPTTLNDWISVIHRNLNLNPQKHCRLVSWDTTSIHKRISKRFYSVLKYLRFHPSMALAKPI